MSTMNSIVDSSRTSVTEQSRKRNQRASQNLKSFMNLAFILAIVSLIFCLPLITYDEPSKSAEVIASLCFWLFVIAALLFALVLRVGSDTPQKAKPGRLKKNSPSRTDTTNIPKTVYRTTS